MFRTAWLNNPVRAPEGEQGTGDGGVAVLDKPATTETIPATGAIDPAKAGVAGDAGGGDKGQAAKIGADGKPIEAKGNMPDYSLTAEMRQFLLGGLGTDAKAKAEKWLGTRSSISDLFKGAYNADAKIQELAQGRVKVPTGKDDKPEDVQAFRKAFGVPEAADKYAIWRPDGAGDMSDTDKEMWGEVLKDAHANNVGQKQVDLFAKAHYRVQETAQREIINRAKAAAEKSQEDLRVEYGRDYNPNVELANRFLSETFPELRDANGGNILDKRFADGTALGEHTGFVKGIIKLAKEAADDGAIVIGESTEGIDVDKRLNELMGLMSTDRAKYASPAVQQEVQRLTAVQMRRQGNGRAA
jgi:hypothetical protein